MQNDPSSRPQTTDKKKYKNRRCVGEFTETTKNKQTNIKKTIYIYIYIYIYWTVRLSVLFGALQQEITAKPIGTQPAQNGSQFVFTSP
jgi:hypothetical protein